MDKSLANIITQKNAENSDIGNKLSDFEILQVLGQGTYGFVAKVKSKLNLKIYALKKYEAGSLNNPNSKKYFINESIFMKQLDHENVIKFYKEFKENNDIYLIMEYMDGGDLYNYINVHMKLDLIIEEEKLWNIFEQCLRGLVYLHKKGLIHRDIKPANLLMNNKGQIKYSDFNVSAIINTDKAREFTKDKNKEEKLLNNMTVVGSGAYCAPEIQNTSIYRDYDLKADIYSLGITFNSLAFFNVDYPQDNNITSTRGYSIELLSLIKEMINGKASERPSAQETYNMLIKNYVKKYVYSSGIISSIQSLFASPSIKNIFFNHQLSKDKNIQMPIYEKLFEIFKEIYMPQQNNMILNNNDVIFSTNKEKKSLYHLIYELRELILKNDTNLKEIGNNEIPPINIITFIIKKLHEELNIYRGKLGNLNTIYTKTPSSGNPKLEAYESYKKFYTNNFKSNISEDFFGLIKTKSICKKCEDEKNLSLNSSSYSFKVLCYIPFNVKILCDMKPNNTNLNIYDAFDCLNHNFIELDKKQFVQCEKCKIATKHKELKQFYNLSKNIVIIFDRGENCIHNTFIDFPEIFSLDYDYVENFKNIKVDYTLISIICKIDKTHDSNKRTHEEYISLQRTTNGAYSVKSFGSKHDEIYHFNQLKSLGTIMVLLYYSDNGIPNFSENMNNNINQNNNIIFSDFNNNNNGINMNNNGNLINNNNIYNNNNIFNGNFNNNMNNIINNCNNINTNNNINNINGNRNNNFYMNDNFNMNNNKNMINNNFQNNNVVQNSQFNTNFNQQQNNINNQNIINNNQNNWNQNQIGMNNNINNNRMNNNINNNNMNNNIMMNGNCNMNNNINMTNFRIYNRHNTQNIGYTNNTSQFIQNNLNNINNNQFYDESQNLMMLQNPYTTPNNNNINSSQINQNIHNNFNNFNQNINYGNNQFS